MGRGLWVLVWVILRFWQVWSDLDVKCTGSWSDLSTPNSPVTVTVYIYMQQRMVISGRGIDISSRGFLTGDMVRSRHVQSNVGGDCHTYRRMVISGRE